MDLADVRGAPDLSHDRALYGLRIASEFPAPDLPAWSGDDRAVDLSIRMGRAPRLADPVLDRPLLQADGEGLCRYAIPGVAAYEVSADGRQVIVEPDGSPTEAEIRTFLFGTVFAIVCMKRGLLPLHACCIRMGDKAVAVAGHSGAGKSTLAANLVARGFPLLADDVTVVDMAGETPTALPAFPRVKLWRDAMDRLDLAVEGLERARPTLEKYHVPVETAFCGEPLPLAGLIHLDPESQQAPAGLRRLNAMEGLSRIGAVIYRQQMMVRLGLRDRQMEQFLRLTSGVGGLRAMRRTETPEELDMLIAQMTALAG